MGNTRDEAYVSVVDVSQAQGRLDAAVMAATGVAGVILRSSDGRDGVDVRWMDFLTVARSSPLLVGTYHFARPQLSAAAEQARFWLQAVRRGVDATGRPLDLPLMVDVEQYWKSTMPLPGPTAVAWLAEFLAVVESEGTDLVGVNARIPSIYTGAPFWRGFVGDSDAFGRYGLVLARYPTYRLVKGADGKKRAVDHKPPAAAAQWPSFAWSLRADPSPPLPPGWSRWDGWQFSADGNQGGHQVGVGSRDVDCNIFSAESVRRWTSTSPIPPVVTTPPIATVPQTADPTEAIVNSLPEVKPGQTNDHVRRVQALLVAAGFNPGAIDGVYGTAADSPTRLAVQAFQSSRGLKPDGQVGVKQTWPALLGV